MSKLIWQPDFCTSNPGCALEIARDWSGVIQVIRYCAHHQALKTGGLTDARVFTAMLQSSRVKEAARWAAKVELMSRGIVDKEYPGLPFTVAADGSFTIQSGVVGAVLTAVRSVVDAAVLTVSRPIGTSTVSVV